jgi:hypothetical protein
MDVSFALPDSDPQKGQCQPKQFLVGVDQQRQEVDDVDQDGAIDEVGSFFVCLEKDHQQGDIGSDSLLMNVEPKEEE